MEPETKRQFLLRWAAIAVGVMGDSMATHAQTSHTPVLPPGPGSRPEPLYGARPVPSPVPPVRPPPIRVE